jgi:hypothetical protein
VQSFGRSPPSRGPNIAGAPQTVRPQDIVEAHSSKGPSDRAGGGDRVPVSGATVAAGVVAQVITDSGSPSCEVLPEGDTNVMMEEVATSDPAASTGLAGGVFPSIAVADDDVAMEEPRVILEQPTLKAPRDVSLDEAMGMACWAFTQAHNVFCRESGGIIDEQRCLLLWASMLMERTTVERVRVEVRQ